MFYPEVRPAEARDKARVAREMIRAGVDPGEAKKATKREAAIASANTFELVAREWTEWLKSQVGLAQYERTLARLENDVFPWLGHRAIIEIDAPEILVLLRRIDARGLVIRLIALEVKSAESFATQLLRAGQRVIQPKI